MTELEIAVSDWKQVCERVALGHHPSVWVGHYRGDRGLGSLHATRPRFEAGIACILLSPFAMSSDVTDAFLVLDRPNHIWVARVSVEGNGVWTTYWKVGYSVLDDGSLAFGTAEKIPLPDQQVVNALIATVDSRDRGARVPFPEAYWAAVYLGREHER